MKTKWSLNELNRYKDEALVLSGQMDIEEELQKRNSQVLASTPISYEGVLSVDRNEYILYLSLSYTLTMPSTRSMQPAEVEMSETISEIYLPQNGVLNSDEEEDDREVLVIELEHDWIDLKEIVADNVLASLPTKVLTEEEKANDQMPEGENWALMTEDQMAANKDRNSEEGDPRFAALKSLFDQDEEVSSEEDPE